MDDAEEIPRPVRPGKKPRVDGDTVQHSPTQAAPVAKVLDDDNLLQEVIVRVGFPTTLVRASLVCKRWLAHASDPKFLSRFSELHPPCLLGHYIYETSSSFDEPDTTRFVPMLPQPPELATVIRRLESYNFGANEIIDCRNGTAFTKCHEGTKRTLGVHRPLCAVNGVQIVPPLPRAQEQNRKMFSAIASKEEGSGLSYLYVFGESTEEVGKSMVRVYLLQDGLWCMHTSAPCLHGLHSWIESMHVDNKIYMPAANGDDIVVFDLTVSSFSTIKLPEGVKYRDFKSTLSPADDASSVYLIDVMEFQLRIWLHKGGDWLLVDSIRLREMFSTLGMSGHTLEDGGIADLLIGQVGDNGQFVILQMVNCIFYLDIKCRTLRKVYDNRLNGSRIGSIHPFMMIWPPTFPALKDDHARKLMVGQ